MLRPARQRAFIASICLWTCLIAKTINIPACDTCRFVLLDCKVCQFQPTPVFRNLPSGLAIKAVQTMVWYVIVHGQTSSEAGHTLGVVQHGYMASSKNCWLAAHWGTMLDNAVMTGGLDLAHRHDC